MSAQLAYSAVYIVCRQGFQGDWRRRPIAWSPEDAAIAAAKIDALSLEKSTNWPAVYTVQTEFSGHTCQVSVERCPDGRGFIWLAKQV